MKRLYLVGALIVFTVTGVRAQISDCEAQLVAASQQFEAGHFNVIASMLKDCLDDGFTKEQRQRAQLLLTRTYQILDDPIGAGDNYLKLLQANPEFIADPDRDPIDLVYLSRKYTASPIFSLSARGGLNIQPVQVVYHVNPNGETSTTDDYTLRVGFQVSAGLDWNLTDQIALGAELGYAFGSYENVTSGMFNGRDQSGIIDRQHWIDVPLTLKYLDNTGLIRPYGYIGYSLNVLIADVANFSHSNNDPLASDGNTITTLEDQSPTRNIKYLRNTLNRSFLVGGGARYKIGLNYLFADVRYSFGNTLVNNKAYLGNTDATLEGESIFDYAYVDDYFRLDRLAFTFGYVKPLYKPRELKRARTRSVLRGIQKQRDE